MTGDPFRGTGRLLRLVLRLNRVRLPIWVVATAATVGLSAVSVADLYGTRAQRLDYAALSLDNAALIVQAGPGYGLDDPSTGAILMNEASVWTLDLVAILGILMTTRHTRLEEESARAELLRSAPVGRHSGTVATLLGVLVAQAAVALAVAATIVAAGYGVVGASAFGAALVCVGMAFSAVTVVAAQVASTSRAATGSALAVLGAAFVVRAVGDVSAPWFSWLSPIHWGQAVRPFAGERWAVLVVPVAFAVAMLRLATVLSERRDFGAGMVSQRPGRAGATRRLGSPLGLAVRLHRNLILGWGIGIVALGFFYGVVADQAEQMVQDNPDLADFLAGSGGSITDAFLATGMLVVGLLAGAFAVATVLRLRSEESAGRADPVLATPVSRERWAVSHLVVALGATVGLCLAGGAAEGLGIAAATADSHQVGRVAVAGLAMAPAPVVLGAVAFVLCAAAPRQALLAWAAVLLASVMGLLAAVLDLPGWARGFSPFERVPALPAEGFEPVPVLVLGLVSAALAGAGLVALRRRDVGRV